LSFRKHLASGATNRAKKLAGITRRCKANSSSLQVASLPEKLRLPIVLCYFEGLTAEAAAERLGCPRGTVLSRLMCRARLIRVLGAILALGTLSISLGVVISQTVESPVRVVHAARAGETEPRNSSKDDPLRDGQELAGEIIVRASDLAGRSFDDGFTGMVAIDPATAKWRTIRKASSDINFGALPAIRGWTRQLTHLSTLSGMMAT
jgi:hypothetical protein